MSGGWRYVAENRGMSVKNEVAEGSDPGFSRRRRV